MKTKRLFVLLLVFSMGTMLIGCGGSSSGGDDEKGLVILSGQVVEEKNQEGEYLYRCSFVVKNESLGRINYSWTVKVWYEDNTSEPKAGQNDYSLGVSNSDKLNPAFLIDKKVVKIDLIIAYEGKVIEKSFVPQPAE